MELEQIQPLAAPANEVGGQRVIVSREYPEGLTMWQYQLLLIRRPEARYWQWREEVRPARADLALVD